MSLPFYIGKQHDKIYTYNELLNWLNTGEIHHYQYLHSNDTLTIFNNIVLGLLSNNNTILLDSSFSTKEIENLIGDYNKTRAFKAINLSINSIEELLDKIIASSAKIGLFTSGTTGSPKLVKHSIKTFINSSRIDNKYSANIWGLAYNPTHMAGIQVFFQALMNKNQIIEIFGFPNAEIVHRLKKFSITHISATPTFYKLLDTEGLSFDKVERVTLGGEKSSNAVLKKITSLFPKARITNIYASTEFGTLFISNGDAFSIRKDLVDKVKIEEKHLFVHQSLIGETAKKLNSTWFDTGDIVQIVSESPLLFKFLGRKSSVVNIGGYNVFPKEIEHLINDIDGVEISRVYAKKNSVIGNILMADVVKIKDSNLTEKKIIEDLKNKIQAFKLPRIIKFVDNISLTRTGKIKQ